MLKFEIIWTRIGQVIIDYEIISVFFWNALDILNDIKFLKIPCISVYIFSWVIAN